MCARVLTCMWGGIAQVVYVRDSGAVPFGARGTIVSVSGDRAEVGTLGGIFFESTSPR